MKKNLNQKLINLIEYYNLINVNFFLSNKPINRTIKNTTMTFTGSKKEKLNGPLCRLRWFFGAQSFY